LVSVKYAILGVFGGVIWMIIAPLISWQSSTSAVMTLVALGVGELIRQKQGKNN